MESNNPKDPSMKMSFSLIKALRDESYKKSTLQGVVKILGLAYVTPEKVCCCLMLQGTFKYKTLDETKVVEDVIST